MKKKEKFVVFLVIGLCMAGGIFGVNTAYKNTRALAFDDKDPIVYFYKDDNRQLMLKFYDSNYNLVVLENATKKIINIVAEEIQKVTNNA